MAQRREFNVELTSFDKIVANLSACRETLFCWNMSVFGSHHVFIYILYRSLVKRKKNHFFSKKPVLKCVPLVQETWEWYILLESSEKNRLLEIFICVAWSYNTASSLQADGHRDCSVCMHISDYTCKMLPGSWTNQSIYHFGADFFAHKLFLVAV